MTPKSNKDTEVSSMTKDELREQLIEKYIEVAKSFYFEGSDEEEEREEYAPKFADEIVDLFDQYLQAKLEEIRKDLLAKRNDADRRATKITLLNRPKFARETETVGESKARNRGFISGILTAESIIQEAKGTKE